MSHNNIQMKHVNSLQSQLQILKFQKWFNKCIQWRLNTFIWRMSWIKTKQGSKSWMLKIRNEYTDTSSTTNSYHIQIISFFSTKKPFYIQRFHPLRLNKLLSAYSLFMWYTCTVHQAHCSRYLNYRFFAQMFNLIVFVNRFDMYSYINYNVPHLVKCKPIDYSSIIFEALGM